MVLASHVHAHGRLRPPIAAHWHNPPLSTPALASPAARYAPSDMHSPAAPGCGAARPNSAATLMLLSVILIVNVSSTTVHAPIPLSQDACSAPTTASHVAHSSSQPCVRRRSPAAAQVHAALCYSEATRLENRVVRWGCGRARSGQLAPQILFDHRSPARASRACTALISRLRLFRHHIITATVSEGASVRHRPSREEHLSLLLLLELRHATDSATLVAFKRSRYHAPKTRPSSIRATSQSRHRQRLQTSHGRLVGYDAVL